MKKVLISLVCILLLCGCSGANDGAHISNEKDVLFSSKDTTYTKGDLYYTLRSYDYSSLIMNDLVYKIMTLEGVDTAAYEENADSTMELYRTLYGLENFDTYGGDEVFRQALIVEQYLDDEKTAIVEENLSAYLEEDTPILAKVVYFENQEDAEAVIAEVNDGATLEMASIAHGYLQEITSAIYLDSDETLPLPVKEYISSNTATGLSPVIISLTTTKDSDGNSIETPRYYLIDILSRDIEDFRDSYLSLKSATVTDTDVFKRVFDGHEIKFYDQETMDTMKEVYPEVFN